MGKKLRKEDNLKTKHGVFDEQTNRTLFKLISQGHFEGLESPISIGKEGNVFSAIRKDGSQVIIKIYRLETCDFNRMYDYLKHDSRFPSIKRGKRNTVFTWTQREFRNLLKAREAGVDVPTPLTVLNNVLVLEYIGEDGFVAAKLKDDIPKDKKEFFRKIISNIKKLYKIRLVHADLSEFNILNLNQQPVFIDFSQCTTLESPRAAEFLERDIRNICNFFTKHGLNINELSIRKQIVK